VVNHEKDAPVGVPGTTPEIRSIIEKVLRLEKEKLYMERPRVRDDIVNIIKEAIRETD